MIGEGASDGLLAATSPVKWLTNNPTIAEVMHNLEINPFRFNPTPPSRYLFIPLVKTQYFAVLNLG
jgi:hypothetical protein